MIARADSHAHLLEMEAKGLDPEAELAACEAAGVELVLDVSTHPSRFAQRRSRFAASRIVRFASGIAPGPDSYADIPAVLSALEGTLRDPGVVAVGEAGLDYHWNWAPREKQLELFGGQIALAAARDLPLIVHCRLAEEDCIATLRGKGLRGIIHCVSFGPELARRFLDLGFMLSFAGNVAYKGASAIAESARICPADMLLTETDSPFLSPPMRRGKPNSPRWVGATNEFIAAIRGEDEGEFALRALENLRRLIGA